MKRIKTFLPLSASLLLVFLPLISYAALVPCDGVTTKCGLSTVIVLFNTALQFLLYVSPFVAAIAFVIAGIMYITAGGDEGRIKTAHTIFTNTLIGFVILLSAWLVVKAILTGLEVKPEFNLLGN